MRDVLAGCWPRRCRPRGRPTSRRSLPSVTRLGAGWWCATAPFSPRGADQRGCGRGDRATGHDRRVDPAPASGSGCPRRSCRPGDARPRRSTRCCHCCVCTPVQRGPRARAGAELCRMAHRLADPRELPPSPLRAGVQDSARVLSLVGGAVGDAVVDHAGVAAATTPPSTTTTPRRHTSPVPRSIVLLVLTVLAGRQHDQREARSGTVRARMAASSPRPGPSEVRSSASAWTTP